MFIKTFWYADHDYSTHFEINNRTWCLHFCPLVPPKQVLLVKTAYIIYQVHIYFYFYVICTILWTPNFNFQLNIFTKPETLPEPPLFTSLFGNTEHMNWYSYIILMQDNLMFACLISKYYLLLICFHGKCLFLYDTDRLYLCF